MLPPHTRYRTLIQLSCCCLYTFFYPPGSPSADAVCTICACSCLTCSPNSARLALSEACSCRTCSRNMQDIMCIDIAACTGRTALLGRTPELQCNSAKLATQAASSTQQGSGACKPAPAPAHLLQLRCMLRHARQHLAICCARPLQRRDLCGQAEPCQLLAVQCVLRLLLPGLLLLQLPAAAPAA